MRGFLSFLNAAYAPFVGFLAFVQLATAVGLITAAVAGDYESAAVPAVLWVLAIIFLVLFAWFLVPMYYFFTWHPEPEWIMDIKVSRAEAAPLYDLMERVAKRCNLPVADDIRLCPLTDAGVYQTKKGKQVLVLGALTVASFTPEVVAAIIAHELAHIESGDTAMLREMLNTRIMMAIQRAYYMTHPNGFLHPFVWLVFLYQFLFAAVFAKVSRNWEYAADQASKRQAGAEDTALCLFHVHVTPHLEGADLHELLSSLARTGDYTAAAFTEQVNNVRAARKKDWKRAMHNALDRGPGLFGTHPSLKSRLSALDVHPEDALDWALQMTGKPMSSQIPTWPELEKKLTVRVLAPYIDAIEAKKEFAAIVKAFS